MSTFTLAGPPATFEPLNRRLRREGWTMAVTPRLSSFSFLLTLDDRHGILSQDGRYYWHAGERQGVENTIEAAFASFDEARR